MTSLMCQFGYSLIFNRVVESTLTYTFKKTNKLGMYFYDQNMAYTPQIIASYLYVIMFRTILGFDANILTLMQVSHLIHIMMTNYDIKNCIISITMILSGQMSNFNIIHLLFNSSMICIGIVLVDLEMIDTVIKKSKSIYLICLDEYEIIKDITRDKINEYHDKNIVVIEEELGDDMGTPSFKKEIECIEKVNELVDINVLDLPTSLGKSNEIGINSQVFDLPKEEFIEAISTTESTDKDVNIDDKDVNIDDKSVVYKSVKKSIIFSKQHVLTSSLTNSDMHLIDDYY